MAELEDELDEIVPAKKTKVTEPVKEKAKSTPAPTEDDEDEVAPKKVAKAEPKDEIEDLDVEFDDTKIAAKGDGLERVRPEKGGKVKRFAFLPFMKLKGGKTHYIEGVGKRRCLSPINSTSTAFCCDKLGKEGGLFFEGLVVEYTNANKEGKYEKGTPIEWEIGYVELSRANLRQVQKLPPEEMQLTDIDIIMSHADRAFGYEFTMASSKARWKINPDMYAEVEAAAQKFIVDKGAKLIGKLGKRITELEWKALLAGKQGDTADQADLGDLSDLE